MISNPGAGGCRHPFAQSTSACDTAGMSTFSRRIGRWEGTRIGAATIGAALVVLLVAFGYAAISIQPTLSSLVAAAAAALTAGAGILYAWREPGR
jgi:hypothetical protein